MFVLPEIAPFTLRKVSEERDIYRVMSFVCLFVCLCVLKRIVRLTRHPVQGNCLRSLPQPKQLRYYSDQPKDCTIWVSIAGARDFFLSETSRPALGLIQPSIQ